jgi:eukaryotic-like serine/threonine-protein kinase
MAESYIELSPREHELDSALADFLRARDAGQSPDRHDLVARYPELEEYLIEEERAAKWATPLRQVSQSASLDLHSYSGLDDAPTTQAPGATDILSLPPFLQHYELLEPIARGGMGVVYKARDRRLNRLVAVKMFVADEGTSPLDLQRYRNEAEVAALLDHPQIVPIYEVGEAEGQAYLVMKFIEGGALSDHLDHFVADPKSGARMLLSVARAVHYAHQRGVLHRDLKPANILIDNAGQAYVADFGLAKRLAGGPELTRTGAIVGTPGYMTPEQTTGRKGAATTATDVYGLGAVLYALLTGRAPFRGDNVLETLEQVRLVQPLPPRRLNPAVARDLELICLKCLEKEPQRRYSSANALAAELERYLDGRPLAETRPVGNIERLGRWCQRNPILAALIFLVVILAATISVISSVGYVKLRAANMQEHASRVRAESHLAVAKSAAEYFTKASEDPRLKARGINRLRREMLQHAQEFYELLVQQEMDNPNLDAERARSYLRLGLITYELKEPKEAIAALSQAQVIFERLSVAAPDIAEYREGMGEALHMKGAVYQDAKDYDEAQKAYQLALPLRQRLVEEQPQTRSYQDALARTVFMTGRLHQVTGKPELAWKTYEDSLKTFLQLAKNHPGKPVFRELLGRTHLNLGITYQYPNLGISHSVPKDPAKAAANYASALEYLQPLARENPEQAEYQDLLAKAYLRSGTLAREQKRFVDAEAAYDEGMAVIEPVIRVHGDMPEYQLTLGHLLHARGLNRMSSGRLANAGEDYRRALEVTGWLASAYPDVPVYRDELGNLCYDVACLDGQLAAAVAKDGKLGPDEKQKRIDALARDAAEQLRRSWDAGLLKSPAMIAHLKSDTDLVAFHGREDFKDLVTQLEKLLPGK